MPPTILVSGLGNRGGTPHCIPLLSVAADTVNTDPVFAIVSVVDDAVAVVVVVSGFGVVVVVVVVGVVVVLVVVVVVVVLVVVVVVDVVVFFVGLGLADVSKCDVVM